MRQPSGPQTRTTTSRLAATGPQPGGLPCTAYCFQLQVKPDRIEEYTTRHAAVWPEMLAGARRHRLAQLLAVPAATTAC